ncbi:hypothetical protein ACQ4PT_006725 [Festuca glaucescens]
MEDVPLPPAHFSFEWPSTPGQQISMDFMAFGRNRDKIVGLDSAGRTFLYDLASRCLTPYMPSMPHSVAKPMSVAVGDNGLFVMSDIDPRFVALMDDRNPNGTYLSKPNWYWQSLPQPPFAGRSSDGKKISAYTVVGDSQIWVSYSGASTYSFDPESGAWSKAGDWALPFRGRAEYVPEHNL